MVLEYPQEMFLNHHHFHPKGKNLRPCLNPHRQIPQRLFLIERRPPSVVVWSNFDTETEEVMSPAEIVTEYRVKPGTVDTLLEAEVPLAQIPKLLEIRDLDETRASSPHGDMVSIANLLDAYMLTEGDVRLISEIVNIARDRRNEERRIRNPLHVSVNEVIGRVLADAREALEESGNLNRLSVEDY
jgi:hypothetical protein